MAASGRIWYFTSAQQMRAWLRANHAKASELQVGYFKRGADTRGIAWPESVAEALCYGWIDGVRRALDDDRYVIRFTPRKPGSTWSAVNIRMAAKLEAEGRMTDAGRAAFAARKAARSRTYSYEQKTVSLDDARLNEFKKNKAAWIFFTSQPPSYQKKALWWVISAKKDEVKDRRFSKLLSACVAAKRLG